MFALAIETLVLLGAAGLLGCILGCFARKRVAAAWGRSAPDRPPASARGDAAPGSGAIHAAETGSLFASRQATEQSRLAPLAPPVLRSAQNGNADDLRKINGIGEKIEKTLNKNGVFHYWQIGDWTRANVRWMDEHLSFKGRIDREAWVPQARKLALEAKRQAALAAAARSSGIIHEEGGNTPEAGKSRAGAVKSGDAGPPAMAPGENKNMFEAHVERLDEPRGGTPDDLRKISGIGPKIEARLHELGVFHYDQIAFWTEAQVAYFDDELKFKGRIVREDWIGQAKALIRRGPKPAGTL